MYSKNTSSLVRNLYLSWGRLQHNFGFYFEIFVCQKTLAGPQAVSSRTCNTSVTATLTTTTVTTATTSQTQQPQSSSLSRQTCQYSTNTYTVSTNASNGINTAMFNDALGSASVDLRVSPFLFFVISLCLIKHNIFL